MSAPIVGLIIHTGLLSLERNKKLMMKRSLLLICLVVLFIDDVTAQRVAPSVYTVYFTDKNGTVFSVANPMAYLTPRAILRRNNQSINITAQDFPVNQNYVSAIQNLGVQVLNRSRWLNAVSILCTDSALLATITNLPFVQHVDPVKSLKKTPVSKFDLNQLFMRPKSLLTTEHNVAITTNYNYGPSYNQVNMLHGDLLHASGFDGQGKVIAVIDAGFLKADSCDTFDSLRANNQILGTWDFVEGNNNVYNDHYHGTYVLSIMGGNTPGELIGTAPKASYWLLRSEDAPTENMVEEFNWVCAAEFADSVGADVINSSLGYTTFDDSTMNHTFSDLDGNTAIATRGADYAASKGIVVCNSAGNEGTNPWLRISVPADADSILTVGAVNPSGMVTSFSGRGFIANGKVKPDVAAQGEATVGQTDPGVFVTGNGTSFSSPLMAGMCASLWQAIPNSTAQQLMQAVRQSCNHFSTPDSLTGYGIPDFSSAYTIVTNNELKYPVKSFLAGFGPNPFQNYIEALYYSIDTQYIEIKVFDVTGKIVYRDKILCYPRMNNKLHIEPASPLRAGIYFISIESNSEKIIKKVIRN